MNTLPIDANNSASERVYTNQGNLPLLGLLGDNCQRLLDIGCGAGDNAALLKARHPGCHIFGVTHSPKEAALASRYMQQCWVVDIEGDLPRDLQNEAFDALLFSHTLEHLRDPAIALVRFVNFLRPGGQVLIAVPNVLSWRLRIQFLFGRFEYETAGGLDETHLHFFTYYTADRHLLAQCPELLLDYKGVTGSVPLWWLRRYLLPAAWSEGVDHWGCRHWPNLFGGQVLIKAIKK